MMNIQKIPPGEARRPLPKSGQANQSINQSIFTVFNLTNAVFSQEPRRYPQKEHGNDSGRVLHISQDVHGTVSVHA